MVVSRPGEVANEHRQRDSCVPRALARRANPAYRRRRRHRARGQSRAPRRCCRRARARQPRRPGGARRARHADLRRQHRLRRDGAPLDSQGRRRGAAGEPAAQPLRRRRRDLRARRSAGDDGRSHQFAGARLLGDSRRSAGAPGRLRQHRHHAGDPARRLARRERRSRAARGDGDHAHRRGLRPRFARRARADQGRAAGKRHRAAQAQIQGRPLAHQRHLGDDRPRLPDRRALPRAGPAGGDHRQPRARGAAGFDRRVHGRGPRPGQAASRPDGERRQPAQPDRGVAARAIA